MIRSDNTLRDMFNSSSDPRRKPYPWDLGEFQRALENKVIRGRRARLMVQPNGIFDEVCSFVEWWQGSQGCDYELEQTTYERLPGMVHLLTRGGGAHNLLGLCVSAWLIDQGFTPVSEYCRWDISTICKSWWIEVGDTCPDKILGAIASRRNPLGENVCVLPFQDDFDEMRGHFDPRQIDMFVFGATEKSQSYRRDYLRVGITDDILK